MAYNDDGRLNCHRTSRSNYENEPLSVAPRRRGLGCGCNASGCKSRVKYPSPFPLANDVTIIPRVDERSETKQAAEAVEAHPDLADDQRTSRIRLIIHSQDFR